MSVTEMSVRKRTAKEQLAYDMGYQMGKHDAVRRERCRYCSPDDGSGMKWDFEDIEVTVTLQYGILTICNQYGDEAEMPIRYCPICGAEMCAERGAESARDRLGRGAEIENGGGGHE